LPSTVVTAAGVEEVSREAGLREGIVASKQVLLDSLAPIMAIASRLSEHEGRLDTMRVRSAADRIIELTHQVLIELDVTSEEISLALRRYNEQDGRVG
jgi:hypothetical protein